jgi:arginase family enzyme
MKTILIAILVVVLVAVVGVGAFFFGRDSGYTEAQNIRLEFVRERSAPPSTSGIPSAPGDTTAQSGQGQRAGGQQIRRATVGTVKSVQGNTVQISAADGSTTNITLDVQTTIQKLATATAADIQPGQRVTVQSDASGSARTIIVGLGAQ